MRHRALMLLLSAYCDGEVTDHERKEVESHVETCTACRDRLDRYRHSSAFLRGAGRESLPAHFAASVRTRLREEGSEERQWIPAELLAQKILIALTVIVIVLSGLTFVNGSQEPARMDRFLAGDQSDSTVSRILSEDNPISKEDILLAVVSD